MNYKLQESKQCCKYTAKSMHEGHDLDGNLSVL